MRKWLQSVRWRRHGRRRRVRCGWHRAGHQQGVRPQRWVHWIVLGDRRVGRHQRHSGPHRGDASNGLALYRYSGTGWLIQTVASGITGFDLVAREGTLFLAYSSGTTLTVVSVDPLTLGRAPVVAPDGGTSFGAAQATAVGELELSANDFGDLALAWSENQPGGWRLLVSELR